MEVAERDRTPLDTEREALVSLLAWSAGQDHFVTVEPGKALDDLTALTLEGIRQSPRLVLLERLVRVAGRRPTEFAESAGDGIHDLFAALVETIPADIEGFAEDDGTPPGQLTLDEAVERLEQALFAIESEVPAEAYPTFANAAAEPLALRSHEMFAPTCDDTTVDDDTGERTVEATFYSALEFDAFERWLDPESWPVLCPWFFLDMDLVRPRASLAAPGAWNAVYDETVLLLSNSPWTTCLFFTFRPRTTELRTNYRLATPADVATHFEAPPAPEVPLSHPLYLAVDRGVLIAKPWASAGPLNQTRVSLSKSALFVDDELNAWTTMLCDAFWLDLAIGMAQRAAREASP